MAGKRSFFELNHDLKKTSLGKVFLCAFLSAALLTGLMYSGMADSANRHVSDQLYQRETALDGNIFVLGIDERALTEIGPFQTWSRSVLADVIDRLNVAEDCHPAVIGVDVMFFGQTDPDSDQRLVEAAAKYDNVVTAVNVVFESALKESGGEFYMDNAAIKQVERPFTALDEVTDSGHTNVFPDEDGTIRHSLHKVDIPAELAQEAKTDCSESFAFQIYKKYAERMGLTLEPSMPMNNQNQWYIPYSAKPGGYGDGFSVYDILSGDLPPEMFADAIVLIGPYTTGMMDSFTTPIDKSKPMYGVEIHANCVDAMLRGEYRQEVPQVAQMIVLFLLLLVLFFPFYFLSITLSTPIMLLVCGAYLFLARQLVFPLKDTWFRFEEGTLRYMLDPLYLPLAVFLLYIGILGFNFLTTQRQKRQVVATFKKYVDPAIINDIFLQGMEELHLGGKKTDICVMFVDIRGFTSMSEIMEPEEVVGMLNEYLLLTSNAIFKYKGTLDKFIGDATMAFFNAPLPLPDYIYQAVLTAWEIVQGAKDLETELYEKYGQSVSFGIGLHCGDAVVGNIGTPNRVDYTAIGNTVNTAARLESNAKRGQVLISSAVYEAVKDRITAASIGNIPLKGKSEEITVYELQSILELEQPTSKATWKGDETQ